MEKCHGQTDRTTKRISKGVKMAKKPVRVKIGKYMGDDCYSWAVFKDGRPVYTGCSRPMAQSYQRQIRKEIGEN